MIAEHQDSTRNFEKRIVWFSILNWLVVWNMNFIFPYIVFFIIPTDDLIFFQRGRSTTNQFRCCWNLWERPYGRSSQLPLDVPGMARWSTHPKFIPFGEGLVKSCCCLHVRFWSLWGVQPSTWGRHAWYSTQNFAMLAFNIVFFLHVRRFRCFLFWHIWPFWLEKRMRKHEDVTYVSVLHWTFFFALDPG